MLQDETTTAVLFDQRREIRALRLMRFRRNARNVIGIAIRCLRGGIARRIQDMTCDVAAQELGNGLTFR